MNLLIQLSIITFDVQAEVPSNQSPTSLYFCRIKRLEWVADNKEQTGLEGVGKMSIGSNFSGITFSGLASGIDTDSIIQRLIALQRRPLQQINLRKAELNARMGAFDQFRGLVSNLQTSAGALSTRNAFNLIKVTSSDTNVVTATASPDAIAGTYDLRVSRLAQAHKLISASHTSASEELGANGSFLLNGKQIQVVSGDSLTSIATKINNAGAGVTASILNGDDGQVFLSLTASETGAKSRIHLSNIGSGTVLQTVLKLTTGSETVRNAGTNSASSDRFSSADTSIGSLFNMSSPPSGTIQINGTNIDIDFANDNLTTIASRINNAGISGVSASVISENENGTTHYRLKITGDGGTPVFTDNNNLLKNLGVLQNNYQNQLVTAQDAEFTVDGVSFKRSSNQVSNVIPGVNFTLLSADATTPKQAVLTFNRDNESIKKTINDFVGAFNSMVDFLKQVASFDKDTLQTGILFGDSTVEIIRDTLVRQITNQVSGLDGTLRVLSQIGIQLGDDGKLKVDDTTLSSLLSSDPNGVGRLFHAHGTTTNPNIQFVSTTDKTKASPEAGYEVVITQAATRATMSAAAIQTSPSTTTERLTFSGTLFGDSEYSITLNAGNTIDDTIAQINNDSRLRNLLTASKDSDGRLVLQAKNYGSSGNFMVVSDQIASSSNSGIGNESLLPATGLDVQGTINGEEAEGRGQFLTGRAGNANTEGLQIRVLATEPGSYGPVRFTRGIADVVRTYTQSVTDIINGDVTVAKNTLQSQIDALNERATRLQEEVNRRELALREQFARLERTLSQMQSQSQRLTAMLSSSTLAAGQR